MKQKYTVTKNNTVVTHSAKYITVLLKPCIYRLGSVGSWGNNTEPVQIKRKQCIGNVYVTMPSQKVYDANIVLRVWQLLSSICLFGTDNCCSLRIRTKLSLALSVVMNVLKSGSITLSDLIELLLFY